MPLPWRSAAAPYGPSISPKEPGEHQSKGAGGAAIRAGLEAARTSGENLVVVLGHADYYPRFGFERASRWGISATFEAPDENLMALALDSAAPRPTGSIRYAPAFGV